MKIFQKDYFRLKFRAAMFRRGIQATIKINALTRVVFGILQYSINMLKQSHLDGKAQNFNQKTIF